MMKGIKKILMGFLSVLLFVASTVNVAHAQGYAKTYSGGHYFKKAKVVLDASSSLTLTSGATVTGLAESITDRTRYVNLGAGQFVLETDGSAPLAAATVPISAKVNASPVLQWAVGDTAKVATTFRVPSDYASGGAFVCMFSLGAASADTTVDFDVYINATGVAFDAAATNQTPVAKSNSALLMQDLTLTVATDTFAAGNVVTFNLWRAAGTGGGATLNLYNCAFSYTADM